MTRQEYYEKLLEIYQPVTVLSRKNEGIAFRLRHRRQNRDIVFHSFSRPCEAFDILCTIRCENLPEIYDVIPCSDGQIILEEYIDGMSVFQHMESQRYHYDSAKKVLKPLLFALSVLHERGLVHRDVKPENVMIGNNGRVVLIDFNASRSVKNVKQDTEILGTVGYAPPEQLGLSESDARTDVYAVGVLLNVMLTGVHPTKRIASGKAGKIVRKCTAVNPNDRFQSAMQLYHAL